MDTRPFVHTMKIHAYILILEVYNCIDKHALASVQTKSISFCFLEEENLFFCFIFPKLLLMCASWTIFYFFVEVFKKYPNKWESNKYVFLYPHTYKSDILAYEYMYILRIHFFVFDKWYLCMHILKVCMCFFVRKLQIYWKMKKKTSCLKRYSSNILPNDQF